MNTKNVHIFFFFGLSVFDLNLLTFARGRLILDIIKYVVVKDGKLSFEMFSKELALRLHLNCLIHSLFEIFHLEHFDFLNRILQALVHLFQNCSIIVNFVLQCKRFVFLCKHG